MLFLLAGLVLGALSASAASWWFLIPIAVRRACIDQQNYERERARSFYPEMIGVPYDTHTHARVVRERAQSILRITRTELAARAEST